jgi:hypothetical protein
VRTRRPLTPSATAPRPAARRDRRALAVVASTLVLVVGLGTSAVIRLQTARRDAAMREMQAELEHRRQLSERLLELETERKEMMSGPRGDGRTTGERLDWTGGVAANDAHGVFLAVNDGLHAVAIGVDAGTLAIDAGGEVVLHGERTAPLQWPPGGTAVYRPGSAATIAVTPTDEQLERLERGVREGDPRALDLRALVTEVLGGQVLDPGAPAPR